MPQDQDKSEHWASDVVELTDRGRWALQQGDGALALDLLTRKHEMVVQEFGAASSSTALSLIDLADALRLVGRSREARARIDDAEVLYRSLAPNAYQQDRLETALMRSAELQGHSFVVEQVAGLRIERLRSLGPECDVDRAVTEDELGRLCFNQGRHDEAIALFRDALAVFDRTIGPLAPDTGICCHYLSLALQGDEVSWHAERFDEAIGFARRALAAAESRDGVDSYEAAKSADDLAIAIVRVMMRDREPALASEVLELSDRAVAQLTALVGADEKETVRARDNNRKLKRLVAQLGVTTEISSPQRGEPMALPTYLFVSHSYQDAEAVEALKRLLPPYVKPIVFDPIEVSPAEFVSDKLRSGVLGAEGFVFIDSDVSRRSFWTAFERDLAALTKKAMFRFDPEKNQLTRFVAERRKLVVAYLHHADDAEGVNQIMDWLVTQRAVTALDVSPSAAARPAWPPDARPSDAVFVVFLSSHFFEDESLAVLARALATDAADATLLCWLEPPESGSGRLEVPAEQTFTLSEHRGGRRPTPHELDNLTVRLVWLRHRRSA